MTPYCRHCKAYGHIPGECIPTYATAAIKSTNHENKGNPENQEKEVTTDNLLFETEDEANAKDTQDWKLIQRKIKEKKINP